MPCRSYYWFDTPDGEDILLKTNFATKIGFMIGTPMAVFDHCLNPQKNMRVYAFRSAAFIVPFMGAGAMFTLTSQLLCKNVPQMKPEYSYMLGGIAAGSVIGAAARSMYVGSVAGVYLGIMAFFGREIHNHEIGTVLGNLPRVLSNEDEWIAHDYRKAPGMSLPPPAARPGVSPSQLENIF